MVMHSERLSTHAKRHIVHNMIVPYSANDGGPIGKTVLGYNANLRKHLNNTIVTQPRIVEEPNAKSIHGRHVTFRHRVNSTVSSRYDQHNPTTGNEPVVDTIIGGQVRPSHGYVKFHHLDGHLKCLTTGNEPCCDVTEDGTCCDVTEDGTCCDVTGNEPCCDVTEEGTCCNTSSNIFAKLWKNLMKKHSSSNRTNYLEALMIMIVVAGMIYTMMGYTRSYSHITYSPNCRNMV